MTAKVLNSVEYRQRLVHCTGPEPAKLAPSGSGPDLKTADVAGAGAEDFDGHSRVDDEGLTHARPLLPRRFGIA